MKAMVLLLLLCALAAPAAAQGGGGGPGGGGGGGKGGRIGARDKQCGATLSVVLTDGSERTFTPAADLLKGMPQKAIDQGENPRSAVKLADLLTHYGAGWLKVSDCAEMSQDLPSGLPVEGELFLVVTGRGSLKAVREVRPGQYANVAQNIKRLRFHAVDQGRQQRRSGK